MPMTMTHGAGREPAFLAHPQVEVVEQGRVRPRARRRVLEMPREKKPSSRDAEKRSAVLASAATETCLGADLFDSGRCLVEARLVCVQTPVGLQVDASGQENPRHPLQARLRKALLAAVLQEPFPLGRVRRDRVLHDVGHLSKQLLEHEPALPWNALQECPAYVVSGRSPLARSQRLATAT